MASPTTVRRTRSEAAYPLKQRSTTGSGELVTYQQRIAALAHRIRATDDLGSIIMMLDEALTETRRLRSPDEELSAARRKVDDAERTIEAMRNELAQVKSLLHEDPLTVTLNRRGIDEAFRQDAARCDRHGGRMCVALLDLDNFKSLNDSLGHPTGDRVLAHVAEVLRMSVRPSDRVGRYGGEEFLVLLPDAGLQEAASVLTRIQGELARRPLIDRKRKIEVTFSAGVAERDAREPLTALLTRVDTALYEAKRAGRNRVQTTP